MTALVCGGLWTAWTFHKLQRVRAAQFAIEKSRIDQEEGTERLLSRQPQPAIDIKVTETGPLTKASEHYLSITITVTNQGQLNFDMTFDESTLTVTRMVLESKRIPSVKEIRRMRPVFFQPGTDVMAPLVSRVFRVGARRQIAFAVPITEPGWYFIQFYALYIEVPFSSGMSFPEPREAIAALEQTMYFATWKLSEPTNSD